VGKLDRLKAAWEEDARDRLIDPEAHSGELTAGGWTRRARAWFSRGLAVWTPRLERLGKWIAALALVVGGMAKIIHDMRATAVGPAELPKTGVASTAVDRVEKPKAP
jgi:hypothetical protein